jgi:hypothetical protein
MVFGLIVLGLAVIPAAAGDVVHLKSGEKIAGETTDGLLAVEVRTESGPVTVPWNRIERIDRGSYVRELYEERARGLADDDTEGRFLLALWCRRHGLPVEMKAELERVLAADPDHEGARRALGHEKVGERWVAGDDILAAKGFVRRDGRWMLKEEAAYEDIVEARKTALSEKEEKAKELIQKAADPNPRVAKFAIAALGGLPWESVRIPLYRALGHRDPGVRSFAAAELGRIGQEEAARPLIRSAILDSKEDVRIASARALRALGQPDALFPLARALGSANAAIRANAALAMGEFGDIRGVEYLVSRLKQNWGPSQRANLSVMNQVSYIQDFDVEIAQAAQIGDPIVGILREGVILDYRLLGVDRTMELVERRLIRGALSKLTGEDKGEDAVAWEKFWAENKERLLAEADAR